MLTKMPQVGDKVRVIVDIYRYVTNGRDYTINGIDGEGDAVFIDDDGDNAYVTPEYFHEFELVSEACDATPTQPIVRITIEDVRQSTKVSANGPNETSYAFTVYADGYDAVERLADASAKQDQRADIERQIAALQKELAAL